MSQPAEPHDTEVKPPAPQQSGGVDVSGGRVEAGETDGVHYLETTECPGDDKNYTTEACPGSYESPNGSSGNRSSWSSRHGASVIQITSRGFGEP